MYATNLSVREAFSELRSLEILDFIGIWCYFRIQEEKLTALPLFFHGHNYEGSLVT